MQPRARAASTRPGRRTGFLLVRWRAIARTNTSFRGDLSTIVFPVATLLHFGVPKNSGKINQRERDICARLKEFREGIRWSQSDFAEQAGITKDQLASIEYGRTPLRYETAWKIRRVFGVSINWLWSGDSFPNDLGEDQKLPFPDATGLPANALITDVFNKVYDLTPGADIERKATRGKSPDVGNISHRAFIHRYIEMQCDLKLPRVPENYVKDFADKVNRTMDAYLKALPAEPENVAQARYDALMWEKIRRDVAWRTSAQDSRQESALDEVTGLGNYSDVKLTMAALLSRLNKATAAHGMKSKLAKYMGVPLPNVSQWLSGEREPSGETTLRLLHWVEQQERKT